MEKDIENYFSEFKNTLSKIQVADGNNKAIDLINGLEAAINLIISQTSKGNKIIFIGNGGSASIASHQAIDFFKNGGMRAICFNDSSLLTCLSNDFGYQYIFEKPIEMFADNGDILVAISSSGKSENIVRGVDAGRKTGCHIITMSGFKPNNPLRSKGKINFYVPSDSYGYVEIAHLILCHSMVDMIVAEKQMKLQPA
ncbi:MAG: SIS domain-containing protein [Deltaproteobacteria bacterium]|nr:SIS domain-containing protein [Deltaproteobacteria bacterium]